MVSCAVATCDVTNRNNPQKYRFHRFPKNPLLRQKWVRIVNRSGWTPSNNSIVCSKHFEAKYIIHTKEKYMLMKDSIPNLFVPVQLKIRKPCSYVNRDLTPPSPIAPVPGPSNQILNPSRKLINKCAKLQKKLLEKNKLVKSLVGKTKRMRKQLLVLETIVEELNNRLELGDYLNDVEIRHLKEDNNKISVVTDLQFGH